MSVNGSCPICGEYLVGDGYTSVIECPNTETDTFDKECDSGPWFCEEMDEE
jgi:hypothetical protein